MVLEEVVCKDGLVSEVLIKAGGHILSEGLHGEDIVVNGSVGEVHGRGARGIAKVVLSACRVDIKVLLILHRDLLDTVAKVVVVVVLVNGDLGLHDGGYVAGDLGPIGDDPVLVISGVARLCLS